MQRSVLLHIGFLPASGQMLAALARCWGQFRPVCGKFRPVEARGKYQGSDCHYPASPRNGIANILASLLESRHLHDWSRRRWPGHWVDSWPALFSWPGGRKSGPAAWPVFRLGACVWPDRPGLQTGQDTGHRNTGHSQPGHQSHTGQLGPDLYVLEIEKYPMYHMTYKEAGVLSSPPSLSHLPQLRAGRGWMSTLFLLPAFIQTGRKQANRPQGIQAQGLESTRITHTDRTDHPAIYFLSSWTKRRAVWKPLILYSLLYFKITRRISRRSWQDFIEGMKIAT